MTRALSSLIDEVLADVDVARNPYLVALADGSLARDDFVETQFQFFHAVTFFARPMAALAAKIPDASLRVSVLRNVWEEHGEGARDKMHGATFQLFLARVLGVDERAIAHEIERRPLWPEVRAFNTLLAGVCVLDEYLVGAATLGIVERMFSAISSTIGKSVVARGFIAENALVHYDLHETLDVRHANDFFDVLAPSWSAGARERELIEQGLRMGAMTFDQLYAGLHRQRARRWLR